MYKIALFGYSFSGKTALFRKMTGKADDVYDPFKPNVGVGKFRDSALDMVAGKAGAKKTVYSEFEFFDFKGFPSSEGFSDDYMKRLLEMDLIVCNVKNFTGESDPCKEANSLMMELILYDTGRIEKLLNRSANAYNGLSSLQTKALEEGLKLLEEEKFLNRMDDVERKLLQGLELLTVKPVLFYINGKNRSLDLPVAYLQQDFAEFSEEIFYNGVTKALNLITFYTIKGDIAQSWVVPENLNARESAGKVHKDIEKGFIRAATLHFRDFMEIGDWHKAKAAGILKFLGPNSKIADRDVVEFYFH
ncbi:MAG TPA: DUF933 domain-containing protein [bacterium]|nr:DUF933 domain-containing protein [bacterium]